MAHQCFITCASYPQISHKTPEYAIQCRNVYQYAELHKIGSRAIQNVSISVRFTAYLVTNRVQHTTAST